MWSEQPSILTEVAIMLNDYYKTKPGVKDLPWPGMEPQSPSPQPVVIAMNYNDLRSEVVGIPGHASNFSPCIVKKYWDTTSHLNYHLISKTW